MRVIAVLWLSNALGHRGCWLVPHSLRAAHRHTPNVRPQHPPMLPAAVVALLVDKGSAATLSSFGGLASLWMVCNLQLYRRYYPDTHIRVTR